MLEIGSIIFLKEGKQKLMVLNRSPILERDREKQFFDYSACLYPLGMMPNKIYYFNEDNIERVLFHGFHDEDEEKFQEDYQKWFVDNSPKIKKGVITHALESEKDG